MRPSDRPFVRAVSAALGTEVVVERGLPGGAHAETAVVRADGRHLVARRFPPGDGAVAQEVEVLPRLGSLGPAAPELVAASTDPSDPIIITTLVPGATPDSALAPAEMARELARMLVRIHAIDPRGLPDRTRRPPVTDAVIAAAARASYPVHDARDDVLVHTDYWCGNALWTGATLTAMVDWSGAGRGNRASDLAWCRQDLALLGAPDAARVLLETYESAAGVRVPDMRGWDLVAGAYAEPVVERWAANYAGIGRDEITGPVLRRRLDEWNRQVLRADATQ